MPDDLATTVIDLLACPECGAAPLSCGASRLACPRCNWLAQISGKIIQVTPQDAKAEFDDLHEVMEENNQTSGVWELMYRQQIVAAEALMRPGMVVLDIGCGPRVPYAKPVGVNLIGVEPSIESLQVNKALDLAICGTAAALPLRAQSVDLILCFYSIHHMTGGSVAETMSNVETAFMQFGRVIKPGGTLLVFEVCPWPPFSAIQGLMWPAARWLLGKHFNFYFWRSKNLERLAERHLGPTHPAITSFTSRRWTTFPPVFAWQWLRLPRWAYPFAITQFSWQGSNRP